MLDKRKQAFGAARSAVKAYARNPSDENAVKVRSAMQTVNDMEARRMRQLLPEASIKCGRSSPGEQ